MAPIDPVQLLKALAPLLSTDGGINGIEKAPQFASLMKKFSKKLVSRCVYCNVLKATAPEILARFLEESGWNTINMWLNDAKENSNQYFLLELLQLCKVLPMTLERLKENNTPKVVKALTKYENSEIKILSNELVTKWMTIIKGDNVPATPCIPAEPVKKKRKSVKEIDKEQKDPKKVAKTKEKESPPKDKKDLKRSSKDVVQRNEKKIAKENVSSKPEKNIKESIRTNVKQSPKRAEKLKGGKRPSSEKESTKLELYEDVKIKVDLEPVIKKPKIDRPKTVKSYQAKFRATGLEEEVPLPKKITKKSSTVDKNTAAAVAKSAVVKRMNLALNDRITEKKIKPETLLTINETSNSNGGIKLIPAKPRPAHILHESASFIDALVATPAIVPKRKKKPVTKPPTPTTPPSPTLKPPKLQFYKDTLEMNAEEGDNKDFTKEGEKESPTSPVKDEAMDSSEKLDNAEEAPGTPTNDDATTAEDSITKKMEEESKDVMKEEEEEEEDVEKKQKMKDPNVLLSILAHGKRRHKRKTVRWVEDDDLKQIFYFELDETERVNVLRSRPFGDLKSLEAKREREVFEAAKRHSGDKMEEAIPWWTIPIQIDVPPALVIPGCYSNEKEIQHIRQQSILQEIYFTREMVPDSPQEPDVELTSPHEPKIIPLDEENIVGSILDYSTQEIPKPKASLPEVLSSLIKIPISRPSTQSILGQVLTLVCPAA